MPRKPIHLELQGGKSPRQRIWEAIRGMNGKQFDHSYVTPGGVTGDSVCDYLGGFLVVVRKGDSAGNRQIWKLVKDPGVEAPRVRKNGEVVTYGAGNEAIWGAMQALGSFTPQVLAEMSGCNLNTVKHYCLFMCKAEYLTVERESKRVGGGSRIPPVYRLSKSRVHGPRPPMITRLKAVYDPNVHQIVWQQDEDDALEAMEAV
jgi:hypothetical protein